MELLSKNEYTFWKYGEPHGYHTYIVSGGIIEYNPDGQNDGKIGVYRSINAILDPVSGLYKLTPEDFLWVNVTEGEGYWRFPNVYEGSITTGQLYKLEPLTNPYIYGLKNAYHPYLNTQTLGITYHPNPNQYPNKDNKDGRWFEKITL